MAALRAHALPAGASGASAPSSPYPVVRPGVALVFPADFGSHPAFRTEWWYVTGFLQDERSQPLGVQITFFRHRPAIAEDNSSRFAPRQLLLAHAAVADPAEGRLVHDQRAARAGFGLAESVEGRTRVHIGEWLLERDERAYHMRASGDGFGFDLRGEVTAPPLLQGDAGYSRKGPRPEEASYYYSEPQLAVSGTAVLGNRARRVAGRAWCDHEWSSEYLPTDAVGWDWAGINLHDGGALMAFVMRKRGGGIIRAAGTLRDGSGVETKFSPEQVSFTTLRTWRSPRRDATYPVATRIALDSFTCELTPLFDDQELDARRTTGVVYWEGAVRALVDGREAGRGYLELTGYAGSPRV
jgi:predicted secreted hydrolase